MSLDLQHYPINKTEFESSDAAPVYDQEKIGNLKIDQSLREKNEVCIKFDYLSGIEVIGKANSDRIKPILVLTLERELGDYSLRSKIIDVINPYINDPEIRKTLIHVMKKDRNPVIRMKAVTVLTKVAIRKEVKKAMIDVLKNDENDNVRFKALETVEDIIDEEILAALKIVKGKERNDLIKKRAERLYKKYSDIRKTF